MGLFDSLNIKCLKCGKELNLNKINYCTKMLNDYEEIEMVSKRLEGIISGEIKI